MDSSFVATITVVQGDSDGGNEDDRNGVRRVAWPGDATHAVIGSPYRLMTWGSPSIH